MNSQDELLAILTQYENHILDEEGYDRKGFKLLSRDQAAEAITQWSQRQVVMGKISILNDLAHKQTLKPGMEDYNADYERGFNAMQSKVKFELKRLKKLTKAERGA